MLISKPICRHEVPIFDTSCTGAASSLGCLMANDALSTFLAARNRLALTLFSAEAYYNVVEAAFLILVLYLALTRAYKPRSDGPSAEQRAYRLATWKPVPLAEPLSPEVSQKTSTDISLATGAGPTVTTESGDELLNLATCNFLGLAQHPKVTARAQEVLKHYGCGSCGPRGFYGTTDVHLRCEDALAKFSGTSGAILYSHGAATSSSTVPAFCKRGDLIVHDERVNFGLQTGVRLSRATTRTFRHCDLGDLEAVLKDIVMADSKEPSRKKTQKRFVMVEGIFSNTGKIAPLKDIVELKKKYGFRLILDESLSLGVLGRKGTGALEAAGVAREDVDISLADLGNAVGTVGGFCVGDPEVVSHQRLSGAGYCFSASQPPFLAAAATTALNIISENGDTLSEKLRVNNRAFQKALEKSTSSPSSKWEVSAEVNSPIIHIRCRDPKVDGKKLTEIQKKCMEKGVLIGRPEHVKEDEGCKKPSLRITLMSSHNTAKLREAAAVIATELMAASE